MEDSAWNQIIRVEKIQRRLNTTIFTTRSDKWKDSQGSTENIHVRLLIKAKDAIQYEKENVNKRQGSKHFKG